MVCLKSFTLHAPEMIFELPINELQLANGFKLL